MHASPITALSITTQLFSVHFAPIFTPLPMTQFLRIDFFPDLNSPPIVQFFTTFVSGRRFATPRTSKRESASKFAARNLQKERGGLRWRGENLSRRVV